MADRERYEVLALLGTGGMGEVYLARPESAPEQRVALKRLRGDRATSSPHHAQFEREARIGMLLRHPNIASVQALGSDETGPYLVLDYVDGCSLERLVGASGEPALSSAELALIAVSIARALASAHGFSDGRAQGVLHRDVSADNVLLSRTGEVKLTDFGVARLIGATALTQTGELKGKIGHLAPEVFEGSDASPAADVWALGVTLFRAASGVDPFTGATQAQVIHAVLNARPPSLATLRPDLDAALVSAVDGCLARDPGARPTAAQLAERLLATCTPEARTALVERVRRHATPSTPLTGAPQRAVTQTSIGRARPKRKKVAAIAAAIAVVAVLGGSYGLMFMRSGAGRIPELIDPGEQTHSVHAPPVVEPAPSTVAPPSTTPETTTAPATDAPPAVVPETAVTPALPQQEPKHEPTRPASTVAANHRKQKPSPSAAPGSEAPKEVPAPLTATEKGFLSLKVRPWGRVFIDGRLVGTTPLAPLELSAGTHSVVIVNEELGARRQSEVLIPAGKTETLRLFLDEAP